MTLRELIEDALTEALESYDPPKEFAATLPPEEWKRIKWIQYATFEVAGYKMRSDLEGAPEEWSLH